MRTSTEHKTEGGDTIPSCLATREAAGRLTHVARSSTNVGRNWTGLIKDVCGGREEDNICWLRFFCIAECWGRVQRTCDPLNSPSTSGCTRRAVGATAILSSCFAPYTVPSKCKPLSSSRKFYQLSFCPYTQCNSRSSSSGTVKVHGWPQNGWDKDINLLHSTQKSLLCVHWFFCCVVSRPSFVETLRFLLESGNTP